MNKRIKKKKIKRFHRRFCSPPFYDGKRYRYQEYQCDRCGWDSLDADPDCQFGKILWQSGGFYDLEFEVEYKCPVCGNVFSYMDGV